MKQYDSNAMYDAFKSKDPRFDGHFFVGVASTGIYCRPVCKARLPKSENCTYYSSAAAAEQEGYRPCLLCRPELAPGNTIVDTTSILAHKTAAIIEENCGIDQKMSDIADHLGCSDRHLRRAFVAEYNVSPIQYLQTTRLLLAKSLLTDTNLSVLDVAMTSGFNSLRRFNDAFKKHYRLTPTGLRKEIIKQNIAEDTITILLGYRPPYCWDSIIEFLASRIIPGVEKVVNNEYYRTVEYTTNKNEKVRGCLKVSHNINKNALAITIDLTLLPALSYILARIRNQFDLECDPEIIYEKLSSMNELRKDLCVLGTRVPGGFDPFEISIKIILEEETNIKMVRTLMGKLVNTLGTSLKTNIVGLTHTFPTPDVFINSHAKVKDDLKSLGITETQVQNILAVAQAFMNEEIDFYHSLNPEKDLEKLKKLSGISEWNAQYIAMRTMGWTDIFLSDNSNLIELSKKWSPWRSYATINLWNNLTKEE